MTFTLGLLASSASEIDWSRPLMIGWIIIALGLSLIEIWLAGGFSSRRPSPATELRRGHGRQSHAENVKEVKTGSKFLS